MKLRTVIEKPLMNILNWEIILKENYVREYGRIEGGNKNKNQTHTKEGTRRHSWEILRMSKKTVEGMEEIVLCLWKPASFLSLHVFNSFEFAFFSLTICYFCFSVFFSLCTVIKLLIISIKSQFMCISVFKQLQMHQINSIITEL